MPILTILKGDTLSSIADFIDSTVAELMALNPSIKDKNRIYVGQKINLPDTLAARQFAAGRALATATAVVPSQNGDWGAWPAVTKTSVEIIGGGATNPPTKSILSNPWILGGIAVILVAMLSGKK